MALPHANWNYPAPDPLRRRRIAELGRACRDLGMERPLLVTDPACGDAMVRDAWLSDGGGLFSDIHSNPVGADVEAGLAAYRAADMTE
jgi:alcohol dehydrogenase